MRYVLSAAVAAIILMTLPAINASGKERKLQVLVDEGTELITTVQLLSGYKYLTPADIRYKKEVEERFKAFKDHRAVWMYRNMSGWFYGGGPLAFMAHYRLPDFRMVALFSAEDEAFYSYSERKDVLDDFLAQLRDFYEVSDFHSFFVSNKRFYDSIAAPIVAESKRVDYIGIMEKHFGQTQLGYRVVLSPIQMDAGFGPLVETDKGNILYSFVGPKYDSDSLPEFDKSSLFQELILHEFSHSFCNPLIDKNMDQLADDSCLLEPIRKDQVEQGYGTWKTCLYEHWTRANETVLNKTIYGQEVADSLLKKNIEEEKWIYLEGLVDLLEQGYQTRRNKYPTIEALMPQVTAYFENLAKSCR
jgi:hypothetical protein